MAQAFERVMLADLEDEVLDAVRVGVGGQRCQLGIQLLERGDLVALRGAALQCRGDEIAGVIDRQAD